MRTIMFSLAMMVCATAFGQSKVYFTKEITPEALVKIGLGSTKYEIIDLDK